MDNATRRQLLDRAKSSGYPGDILDVFSAYDQGKDLIGEYVQEQQMGTTSPPMQIAQTPQEQGQGLRPFHEQGQIDQSMAFPNVQPGQSFNTVGMKVPINIDKVDNQGNLVESYKAVPPGIQNLPTGPYEGTVIESPARMKTGGAEKDPPTKKKIYTEKDTDEVKTTFKDWGTGVPKPTPPIRNPLSEADLRKGYTWSPELGVIAPQVEITAERPYELVNVPGGHGSMVTAKRYKDGNLSYSPETVAAMNASNEIARSNNVDRITKGFAMAASLPTVGRLLGTEILGTGINAGNILNPLFIGHGIYNTVNPNSDFRQAITKYNQGEVGWENVAFEGGLNALNFLGARALPGDIKALGNIKAPRFKNVSTNFMSLDAPKGNMYGENQVLVQQARLLNPATKAKFFKHQAPMVEVTPDKLQKTPKDYNNRITPENYEDFVKKIHGSTDYDFASTVYKQPTNLGIGNYGIPGMVFKDAPLSNLGKDVINAHEKIHGIFTGTLSRKMEEALLKPFGTKKPIPNYPEKAQADEVLGRMAQFKNALGMGDDQIFTLGHLNWIRKNYANSFIDNGITAMLSKIKPGSEAEKEFLRNMNEYAFGIGALTAVGTAAVNKPPTVVDRPPDFKTGGVRKYQTAGLEEEDKRTLESGTIVDKGTNTLNVVKGGKITQTFPVLTGQAGRDPKTDVNRNVGSLDDLESNPAARSTPTGVYKMAPNPNVYGWPGYDLNPISAFGQAAPAAEETAIHITYGANPKPGANLEGHPDPAEFKRRNAAYNMDSSKRYLSYGCTNAQGEAINCLEQTFPQGDTAIYIDSRFDRDSRFFDKFRNEEPPVPVREEEPIVAQRPEEQPEERPIRYTFDPEFGTVISSPIEVTPTTGKKKSKSKAKKRETGGPDTNQEVAMYEWRSGLPEDSRKRYFIGGLKNRVLYNKAKYKR